MTRPSSPPPRIPVTVRRAPRDGSRPAPGRAGVALALVRHGATELNLAGRVQGESEAGLCALGRRQADAAGESLAGLAADWAVVASSPQRRAVQTAERIAAHVGRGVGLRVPQLRERRYGAAEGLSFPELYDRWQVPEERRGRGMVLDWLIARGAIPGAEPIDAVRARGLAGLATLADWLVAGPVAPAGPAWGGNPDDALAPAADARGPVDAGFASSAGIAVAHGTLIRCTLEAIGFAEPLHLVNGGFVLLRGDADAAEVGESDTSAVGESDRADAAAPAGHGPDETGVAVTGPDPVVPAHAWRWTVEAVHGEASEH